MVITTPYMAQTPVESLHDIADLLWVRGEHAAYRSLKAYIKERDQLITEIEKCRQSESNVSV